MPEQDRLKEIADLEQQLDQALERLNSAMDRIRDLEGERDELDDECTQLRQDANSSDDMSKWPGIIERWHNDTHEGVFKWCSHRPRQDLYHEGLI